MDTILILDYGSQYTQLIARRIREQHVYSEIVPFTIAAETVRARAPKGVILSGGPNSVFEEGAPGIDRGIFGLGIPVLGVCYGMQLMSQELGGKVQPGEKREYGKTEMTVEPGNELFKGLPDRFVVWMSHGDRVAAIPDGFKVSAKSANCPFAAVRDEKRRFFGIQFHPEVVHTEHGKQILSNFIFNVCRANADWQLTTWIDDTVEKLKRQVDDDEVVLGLSGGVDSSVAAVLLHKAIGKTFIDVFADEARKFRHCRFLGQGTIYPDVIESSHAVKGPSQTIKSHHNVGGLPPDLKFELVEPLRDLFKDEVRAVGRVMGMADELLDRQPFPGPGLGVRILGEVTEEKVKLLQQADLRVQEEVRKLPDYKSIWQTFAVLLPVKTVGVMGDQRTYEYTCAIRSVDSIDAMTADWTRLPYETLGVISNRIINEVRGINRVVYDISSKPPATIEWE